MTSIKNLALAAILSLTFLAGCEVRIPAPHNGRHCDSCCEKCGCGCCCKSCENCPTGCCSKCQCQKGKASACPKTAAGLTGGPCPDCSNCHE